MDIKEINEETRGSFKWTSLIQWIAGVICFSWVTIQYFTDQKEKDFQQDTQINLLQNDFKKFQETTDKKLDKIITNQELDHTFVIKHEYMNSKYHQ